jgi:hypothetical protein
MQELLDRKLLVDPRDATDRVAHAYFQSLPKSAQEKLRYLAPLDGWLAIIIYPALPVKNAAQQHPDNGIAGEIRRIKSDIADHGNRVERGNWPIEMDLDSGRHF